VSFDSGLDVAVQEDGKIVVAGNVTSSATGTDFAVARYRPDGSPDPTFGSGGQVVTPVGADYTYDEAYGIAVRPDGKIVAAGFTSANGSYDFAAVRYNEDGSLDTDSDSDPATHFDTDGKVITPVGNSADFAVDVAVQGTQTILSGRSDNGSNDDFAMVRYDDNGNLDNSFGTGGVVTTDFFGDLDYSEDIAIEPAGKIVLAGFSATPTTLRIAKTLPWPATTLTVPWTPARIAILPLISIQTARPPPTSAPVATAPTASTSRRTARSWSAARPLTVRERTSRWPATIRTAPSTASSTSTARS